MDPLLIVLILLTVASQVAVFFLIRQDRKSKAMLKKQYKEISRHLFEVSLLNSIQDKIGYSLNIRGIADTIAQSVQELFEITTVSYVLIENDRIIAKSFLREGVQDPFLAEVERLLLQGIYNLDPETSHYKVVREPKVLLIESYTVLPLDTVPKSFFNIPLVVNNKLVGMINVASRSQKVYQEEDMSMLYKIVTKAEEAYNKLKNVIDTEQAKLASMVGSLPTGILLLTYEESGLQVSYINSSARELLRVTTEVTFPEALAAWYPDIPMADYIKSALNEKKAIILRDVKLKGKSLNLYITPIFIYETEKIVGISIAMRNVTLEKEVEEMRQNFTDMVVHELRAPLTSIKGASSLLQSGKLSKEESAKMLQLIADSSTRMMDDVGDLLDAAKIEEGRFKVNLDTADLNTIIREKVALFSFNLVTKHLELHLNLDKTIPPFLFDRARIGQVVNNLISNSIKYTPSGGQITITTTQEGGKIKVLVSDTGIGIPEDKKAVLFSKYGQVHDNLLFQGTGLGLYISKGIVESHKGTIWIDSQGASGTTVGFSLPFVQKEEAEQLSSSYPSSQQKIVN